MASLSFFGSSHEISTSYWVSLLVTRKLEATAAIAFQRASVRVGDIIISWLRRIDKGDAEPLVLL